MSTEIDTRITPALHPHNVRELEGYDEETAPVLGLTETAFSEAYQGIREVLDAKLAVARNPTLNEAAQLIRVDDFAQQRLAKINKTLDAELARLTKAVASMEQELSQPLESRAAHPLASEIRMHLKSMSTGERHTFLQQAIDDGDHISVSSALGAPAYLSGLDAQFHQLYTRYWNERASPTTAKRLKVMQGAKELIEKRGGLAMKAVLEAVGFITEPKSKRKIYAADLRKQVAAAEAPFAAREA